MSTHQSDPIPPLQANDEARPACSGCGSQMLRELTSSQRLAPSCEVCRLALLLIALQIADALVTLLGIRRYGVLAEGNPFVREMMSAFGAAEILTLIKLVAVLSVVVLVRRLKHNSKAVRGLFLVTCFYVVAVLLPWSYFLFIVPLSSGALQ